MITGEAFLVTQMTAGHCAKIAGSGTFAQVGPPKTLALRLLLNGYQ
jgi:hypothetical protein